MPLFLTKNRKKHPELANNCTMTPLDRHLKAIKRLGHSIAQILEAQMQRDIPTKDNTQREECMDKKLKSSEKKIEKKIDKSEKTVEKEFKNLLKEDHKIDKRLETAENKLRKRK